MDRNAFYLTLRISLGFPLIGRVAYQMPRPNWASGVRVPAESRVEDTLHAMSARMHVPSLRFPSGANVIFSCRGHCLGSQSNGGTLGTLSCLPTFTFMISGTAVTSLRAVLVRGTPVYKIFLRPQVPCSSATSSRQF